MSRVSDPDDILKTKTICDYCKKEIFDIFYTAGHTYEDLHYECWLRIKNRNKRKVT